MDSGVVMHMDIETHISISAPVPVLVSSSIWVLDRFLSHVMNRYWYHIRSQPVLVYDSLLLLTIFLEIVFAKLSLVPA